MRAEYLYAEPSDLAGINAARPLGAHELAALDYSVAQLLDKLHGAWTEHVAGCLLGRPIEGVHSGGPICYARPPAAEVAARKNGKSAVASRGFEVRYHIEINGDNVLRGYHR